MSGRAAIIAAINTEPMRWVRFQAMNQGIGVESNAVTIAKFGTTPGLRARVDMTLGGNGRIAEAYYLNNGREGTIYLPFHGYGGTWEQKAMIVHEMTHAALDLYNNRNARGQRVRMRVVDDEAFAYLAQALYLLASPSISYGQAGTPLRAATDLARGRVLGSGGRRTDAPVQPYSFSARDLAPLRTAIRNDDMYRAIANQSSGHDGLGPQ